MTRVPTSLAGSVPAGAPWPVAVVGATGSVGQRFCTLLADHPWFRIATLAASARSAGRAYGDVVSWAQDVPLAPELAAIRVSTLDQSGGPPLVFSALSAPAALEAEVELARNGQLVVSNASAHRMDPDVPLLIPEVNGQHLELARTQAFDGGGILTNPNCTTIGLVLALAPLQRAFGVERVFVTTHQALSGAGLDGPSALSTLDNLIPHIPDEEQKLERETQRILGTLEGDRVRPAPIIVSAQCNRVPVLEGHTLSVSVALGREADAQEMIEAWRSYRGAPQELRLPSAPERPLVYLDAEDAPQPRLHKNLGAGMTVSIGRLRPCALLGHKFTVLVHNTLRGAAGGALLVAELAACRGWLGR